MKTQYILFPVLVLLAAWSSVTKADPIPYPHQGTEAHLTPSKNRLKGTGSDVIAYYDGTGAAFYEQVGLYINGILTPAGFVFPNHNTPRGKNIDLGFASAGTDLVFGVQVYDYRLGSSPTGTTTAGTGNLHYTGPFSYTIYSVPSDPTYGLANPGYSNQAYITAFTAADVSAAIPVTGTYVGFEDLLANGASGRPSDFNYTDEQFVFTGISSSAVPETGTYALLTSFILTGAGFLARRHKSARKAI